MDADLIAHLGELARIDLTAAQQAALRTKLEQLVGAFSNLAEVDFGDATDPKAPSGTRTISPDELRKDAAEAPPTTSEVLANAPQTAADCFVVARVIEP